MYINAHTHTHFVTPIDILLLLKFLAHQSLHSGYVVSPIDMGTKVRYKHGTELNITEMYTIVTGLKYVYLILDSSTYCMLYSVYSHNNRSVVQCALTLQQVSCAVCTRITTGQLCSVHSHNNRSIVQCALTLQQVSCAVCTHITTGQLCSVHSHNNRSVVQCALT